MCARFPLIPALAGLMMLAFAGSPLHAQSNNDAYRDLLAKYVAPGPGGINLVDYAKWKSNKGDHQRLAGYIAHLQTLKPTAMTRNEAIAFWVNLYNATTLEVVLDHYPVRSIREIESDGAGIFDLRAYDGPWRSPLLTVEHKQFSLDAIEHEILRERFRDPRIHYALNCASLGCPNLKLTPWDASSLDADLDAAAKAFINHPRAVAFGKDGQLRVSSLYSWYKQDFGGSEQGVVAHLRKYAHPDLAQKLKAGTPIAGDGYDWSLNDSRHAAPGG